MEAATASSGFGSGQGLARSSPRPSGGRGRYLIRLLLRHPLRPVSRLVVAAANPQQQVGVEGGQAICAATNMEPERGSPREVMDEIARCYELVSRLGRGAVYLGSSRVPATHPHYHQTAELAREATKLLDCTTWTGAGPGLMDAANQGALEADKPVGGFKIGKEAGEWTTSNFHPYLPSESYHTCRFFSARKHGLVDAVVRNDATVKTAIVALPGGIGTLDEVFEIMALIQLERIGSTLPVPFLLMNYDFYYSKLLEFLDDCKDWGTVAPGEVASLWKVCNGNYDALEYLAQFYNVPAGERNYDISPLSKEHRSPPYTIPR
nr:probable cytokinin riboside 5'-monophosphate phosphoribohydrolase LOGL10 [Lolium perenne]